MSAFARRHPLALAVALFALALTLTFFVFPWSDTRINDLVVYRADVRGFLDGQLPYRDLPFEYPPLAALVMLVPGLVSTTAAGYEVAFALVIGAIGAGALALTAALARRTGGDARVAAYAFALTPLLTGAMIRTHFDLAPVALTLAALALLVAERPRAAMVALGLGVMTKGFPIIVAPVALAWLWARRGRAEALRAGAALAVTAVALAGAATALSPGGAWDSLTYQTARAPEVESAPAAVLLAAGDVRNAPPHVGLSHAATSVFDPANGIWTDVFLALGLVAVALLAASVARAPTARNLVLAALAAVAAYAAFGKVLSPQFLVWTLPLLALAAAWRQWPLAAALAVATVLTLVEFPAHYQALVSHGPFAIWLVVARDLVLIAAVVLATRALSPRAAARSTAHGR